MVSVRASVELMSSPACARARARPAWSRRFSKLHTRPATSRVLRALELGCGGATGHYRARLWEPRPPEVAGVAKIENRKKVRGAMREKGLLRHASADDDTRGCDSNNYGFLRDFPSWAAHGAARHQQPWVPADGGDAQPLARALPASGRGASQRRREGGVGAGGLQSCPPPRLPGCRALEHAASGSWNTSGRIPTVAFPWKFMQEKPGSKTDCLHLFLKEPSSGRVKSCAKGPL